MPTPRAVSAARVLPNAISLPARRYCSAPPQSRFACLPTFLDSYLESFSLSLRLSLTNERRARLPQKLKLKGLFAVV